MFGIVFAWFEATLSGHKPMAVVLVCSADVIFEEIRKV